jgi:vesicle coat complex subunit
VVCRLLILVAILTPTLAVVYPRLIQVAILVLMVAVEQVPSTQAALLQKSACLHHSSLQSERFQSNPHSRTDILVDRCVDAHSVPNSDRYTVQRFVKKMCLSSVEAVCHSRQALAKPEYRECSSHRLSLSSTCHLQTSPTTFPRQAAPPCASCAKS